MEPSYERFDSEAAYRIAVDLVIAQANSSLQIFDTDLARMQLERPACNALLRNFLSANPAPQIRIVLRERDEISNIGSRCPRLMDLLERYSHFFSIRKAPDNLLHLADCHVIADDTHCVRRFHIDHPRGALIANDPAETLLWSQRFEELWELSQPWSGARRLTL